MLMVASIVVVVMLSAVSFMIFSIQSENLATFVNTPGRPTGHPVILQEVIPTRVALPLTFLIKPPEIIKMTLQLHILSQDSESIQPHSQILC